MLPTNAKSESIPSLLLAIVKLQMNLQQSSFTQETVHRVQPHIWIGIPPAQLLGRIQSRKVKVDTEKKTKNKSTYICNMQIISNAMTLNLLGGKFQICTGTRMFDWNHPSSRLSTTTESVMIILFLFF